MNKHPLWVFQDNKSWEHWLKHLRSSWGRKVTYRRLYINFKTCLVPFLRNRVVNRSFYNLSFCIGHSLMQIFQPQIAKVGNSVNEEWCSKMSTSVTKSAKILKIFEVANFWVMPIQTLNIETNCFFGRPQTHHKCSVLMSQPLSTKTYLVY